MRGILFVVDGPFLQCLYISFDGGDRCLQFMGDVGHELTPDILEMTQSRYIIENDKGADTLPFAIAQHRTGDLQKFSLGPWRTISVLRLPLP